jgi:hypothetical protein
MVLADRVGRSAMAVDIVDRQQVPEHVARARELTEVQLEDAQFHAGEGTQLRTRVAFGELHAVLDMQQRQIELPDGDVERLAAIQRREDLLGPPIASPRAIARSTPPRFPEEA